jgi:hypothetical protein
VTAGLWVCREAPGIGFERWRHTHPYPALVFGPVMLAVVTVSGLHAPFGGLDASLSAAIWRHRGAVIAIQALGILAMLAWVFGYRDAYVWWACRNYLGFLGLGCAFASILPPRDVWAPLLLTTIAMYAAAGLALAIDDTLPAVLWHWPLAPASSGWATICTLVLCLAVPIACIAPRLRRPGD